MEGRRHMGEGSMDPRRAGGNQSLAARAETPRLKSLIICFKRLNIITKALGMIMALPRYKHQSGCCPEVAADARSFRTRERSYNGDVTANLEQN